SSRRHTRSKRDWSSDVCSSDLSSPRPLQKPHPPIWIGANADPAIRRAARLGDCWYVNPHNRIETIVRQVEVYKRALDEYRKPFQIGRASCRGWREISESCAVDN